MDGCLLIESDYSVEKAIKIHSEFFKKNKFDTQITYNFHNSIFDPSAIKQSQVEIILFKFMKIYILPDFFSGLTNWFVKDEAPQGMPAVSQFLKEY